jgi:superfamily II DNA or RNA helicase
MPTPLFKQGESVLLRSTKDQGRVEAAPLLDGGEYWYRVRFARRIENVVEEDLEPLGSEETTLQTLVREGRWGRMQAFRSSLAVERLTHANQNTLYSYRAQRILFEAFQYKPLLKVLESPDRRVLIADEVGLGKTIETGLILTELEARQPIDRILIVCPSRLREKWRNEMSRKFGQEFDLMGRAELSEFLDRLGRNYGRGRLRAVVSVQTMRNTELRERFLAEAGGVGLLVMDEAHHARNPSSLTSEMLRNLCEVADAVLLLTATPLHLNSRDLFTLLQALRPVEFNEPMVFDQRLRRFESIHEAALLVRAQQLGEARKILARLFIEGVQEGDRDPIAVQLLADSAERPADKRGWVELERRVQDLHPLASIITRTRKRDVQEHAAVRNAMVCECVWTDEEDAVYRRLVAGSSKRGWINRPMTLGQIQRARQAASCLPAALAATGAVATTDDTATEQTDLLPSESGAKEEDDAPPPIPLSLSEDSKLNKLLEILTLIDQKEPGEKVLVFTYFVGTSHYLVEQLERAGFPSLRIAGDVPSDPKRPKMDERGKRMDRFRDDPSIRVLVSTEVGSEGLDFQFCHHLVNYDLPWNPMVVEQRIGRIDRFGQKSKRVNIFNLVVEGTVEDVILLRLYNRIGIFERSIGQLEAILGESVSKLQADYVGGRLTPEEAAKRVEEAARAIEQRRRYLEELEKGAGRLLGHEDYLRDQLRRVGHLGRYVGERAMLAIIQAFLAAQHPSSRLKEEPAGLFRLRLTEALSQDIQRQCAPQQAWIPRLSDGMFSFCFDGERAFQSPGVDLVNARHPFLLAAVEAVRAQLENIHARIAKGRLVLKEGEDMEVPSGTYFLLVWRHTITGIRARRLLETVAWDEDRRALLPAEASERLLHLVQEQGIEWDTAIADRPLDQAAWDVMESEARRRSQALRQAENSENQALYLRRRDLLGAEHEHDRRIKEERLATARARGRTRVLPAMEAQIANASARFNERLKELESLKEASCRLSDPIAACMVEVRR